MKIKTPKYKNMVLFTVVSAILILGFEILPGYYNMCSNLVPTIFHKLSGVDDKVLLKQLITLKEDHIKLKKQFFGEFADEENNYSFSHSLEMFNMNRGGFDISINSIKPIKKYKKGRLIFQKINIGMSSNFENIYNYCRWLEITRSAVDFEEMNISKPKDNKLLQANILLDVLHSGFDE